MSFKAIKCLLIKVVGSALFLSLSAQAGNMAGLYSEAKETDNVVQRYYVKYSKGKAETARTLLQNHEIQILDSLPELEAYVVTGSKDVLDKIIDSKIIDFYEPEPTRKLYGNSE